MVALVYIVLFLALTGHSSATYCLCKDGNEQYLQKTLDYACGAGADCTAISQNGACYQPNTVKDHCNWAVNSYFQRKSQAQGSCDFSGTATVSQNPPATQNSNCVFPSSPQTGTSTSTGTVGTPSTSTTPSTGTVTPSTSTTTPSTGTGTVSGTGTGTGTGITSPTSFGISPTGTTTGIPDGSNAVAIFASINVFFPSAILSCFSGFLLLWG